ncbi:MAG: SpoIID/LytB domain-containing protein [Planctomycetota bacterium]
MDRQLPVNEPRTNPAGLLRQALTVGIGLGLLFCAACVETNVTAQVPPAPEPLNKPPPIAVLVMAGRPSVLLEIKGHFTVCPLDSEAVINSGRHLKNAVVRPDKGGFILDATTIPYGKIRLVPEKGAAFHLDGKRFTGEVVLVNKGDAAIDVIDRLDLESYLCGVLQGEVSAKWPEEALKAQVVASRTYALYHMRSRTGTDYDVDATTMFQVYIGGVEPPAAITRAVRATSGMVMLCDGAVFEARFSSCCGGATENNDNVFHEPFIPVLAGRTCGFCGQSPDSKWEAEIDKGKLTEALRAAYPDADYGAVREVEASKSGVEGRVIEVTVRHANGVAVLNANDFRLATIRNLPGKKRLRSMRCKIENTPTAVRFTGSGWGHGVGMCQWGAKGMADAEHDFIRILKYYYTGCGFRKLY